MLSKLFWDLQKKCCETGISLGQHQKLQRKTMPRVEERQVKSDSKLISEWSENISFHWVKAQMCRMKSKTFVIKIWKISCYQFIDFQIVSVMYRGNSCWRNIQLLFKAVHSGSQYIYPVGKIIKCDFLSNLEKCK